MAAKQVRFCAVAACVGLAASVALADPNGGPSVANPYGQADVAPGQFYIGAAGGVQWMTLPDWEYGNEDFFDPVDPKFEIDGDGRLYGGQLWFVMGEFAVAAVQPGGASQFIRQLGDQAIAALRAPDTSLEAREAQIRNLLSEGFDLPFIGRFVLGRYWEQATPEQRSDYLALFGEYVLKTYSARLGGYAGESMTILSERPAGTKDIVVNTRIERPSGPPIEADWRVRTSGERYRIIDVMVAGVSMVVTQRSEFTAVVRRHGLQGLIEVLRAH